MEKYDVTYVLLLNEKGSKILMVNNSRNEGSEWTLPGGEREIGETLEQSAVREVKEETGLNVEVGDLISVNECFFPEANLLFFTFLGKVIDGEITISRPDEILDVKWMDLEEADKQMPYFKGGISRLIDKRSSAEYYFEGTLK